MKVLDRWSALNGIAGNKVYLKLDDVILVEDVSVRGEPVTQLTNRWGVRVQVEHSAEEIMELIEMDIEELMKRNVEYWKAQNKRRDDFKKDIKKRDKVAKKKKGDDGHQDDRT